MLLANPALAMHSQSGVDGCEAVCFQIGPQNIEVGQQLLSGSFKGEQAKGQFEGDECHIIGVEITFSGASAAGDQITPKALRR